MEPGYLLAHRILGAAYLASGRASDAIGVFERALSAAPDDPALLAWLAHARAVTHQANEAEELIDKLIELKSKSRLSPGTGARGAR
jgi:cytochrome c-type biogenesis protein CcmH/NrfG